MTGRNIQTATLAVSALLMAGASAQTIPEIPYDEFYLDNGLRVIVHEDRKAPIVAVTLWYHVGSKDEQPGKTGFAHLFEHLMFNGSENYNDEYFGPFEDVGATSMNGTTDNDRTNYFETVPSTAVDLALWMESDRMGNLLGVIDQDKLDEQRGVVQNEKRQRENQPYGGVFDQIMENLFPDGHPYSWSVIGSMDDLDAATLDDVYAWFQTYYGPNNATLVLAGDIDVETARERVTHYFGSIPPGPPQTKREYWTLAELDSKRIIVEDRVPQARIYKAWRGPRWKSDDSTLLLLADYVLTSGKTSRFYNRLVYSDQIASDAGAALNDMEISGAYIVIASALPGVDLASVEQALDEELERFLDEGPTRAELERVKTELKASFVRGVEQVGGFRGKSNILATNAVFGGSPDFYQHSMSVLENATPEQVVAAARRWLTGNTVTVEVHPISPNLGPRPQDVDRSRLPMPTSFPEGRFPEISRTTLSNGMRVLVAERSAVPVVQFSLQFDAGYASDQFGKLGTASLAMSMLDEGTTSRDALEISDELTALGASVSSGSNLDQSSVGLSALKENLDDSLEIYADIILNPSFPESELGRLRALQLNQIQREKASPQQMALRVLPQLLYGDEHAYGMALTGSGTEESVASITRRDLIDFHDDWFKPNHATMIVTGDITLAEVESRLEALFSDWRPGDTPDKTISDVQAEDSARVFLMDRPGAEQSYIIAGHLVAPLDVDTEPAIDAMNDVLGGSFTSRINMNLREDKGWSYGVQSLVLNTQAQRPFLALAPVQTDQTAASITEIQAEINNYLGAEPATDDEVATAKRNSTLTLPGRWETAGDVARDLAQLERFDLPDDYWDRYADLVNAVDTDAVHRAARATLRPEAMTWLIVGDLATIRSDVEALGIGPIAVIDTEGRIINTP